VTGTRIEPGKLVPDLVGIGILQVVEGGQGLPPGVAGGRLVTGRVPGVAEVRENLRLRVAVAYLAEQGNRPLVAGDGLAVEGRFWPDPKRAECRPRSVLDPSSGAGFCDDGVMGTEVLAGGPDAG
jgi:hypothetical protein